MALFFDAAWFDARLRERGATRTELAAAMGLALAAVDEIFKDQREMSRAEVEILAAFVGAPAETVADRAGIATPRPSRGWAPSAPAGAPAVDLDARLARIEAKLDRLLAHLAKN